MCGLLGVVNQLSICLAVCLVVSALAVLGAGYEDDPMLTNPELDWCFSLTVAVTVLSLVSFLFRLKAIAKVHNIAPPCSCCFNCKGRPARTKPATAKKNVSVTWSKDSVPKNDSSKLPSIPTRRMSLDERVVKPSPIDDRNSALPPLPPLSMARAGSRSSDSGMESRDVSRDSTLDEVTGNDQTAVF